MWLLTGVIVLTDLLIALLGLEIAAVLLTGGGEFTLGTLRVSARSVVNPLIALAVLVTVRFAWTDRPFTFHKGLSRRRIRHAASSALDAAWYRLASLDGTRARRFVLVVAAASLVIKLANIFWYRGFYSGDDVEIHEMTLGLLFQRDWPIWNLRSPIFPVGFIYPVQWALGQIGVSGTTPLVLAGRLVVAVFSTANVWLLWAVAFRQWQNIPIALLAATFLAFSGLHVQFGSSELPRTVATTFVLAAVWLLQNPNGNARGLLRVIAAGLFLGLAGAIRFSEAMFLAPAAAAVALQRKWGASVLLGLSGVVAYVGLICLGDWLYWGSPFYSGRHIVQFTLVDRLSSRGYEPWHYYLSHVLTWSNPFAVVAVAVALMKDDRRYAALWVGIPMLLLSLLPHKEPRYLLPILPFWCAVAAVGAWRAVEEIRNSPRRSVLSIGFLALLAISFLVEVDRFRFRRSADAVQAMEFVAAQHPKAIAFEESWTGGGWLYVGTARLVDLQLRNAPNNAQHALAEICGDRVVDWVVLRRQRASDYVRTLKDCGFGEIHSVDLPPTYTVFRRNTAAAASETTRGPSAGLVALSEWPLRPLLRVRERVIHERQADASEPVPRLVGHAAGGHREES